MCDSYGPLTEVFENTHIAHVRTDDFWRNCGEFWQVVKQVNGVTSCIPSSVSGLLPTRTGLAVPVLHLIVASQHFCIDRVALVVSVK